MSFVWFPGPQFAWEHYLQHLLLTELSLITPLLCICFWLLYTNFSGSLRSAFIGLLCRSLVPFEWAQVLGLRAVMKGGAWGLYIHHDVVSHFENDFSKSPANSIYWSTPGYCQALIVPFSFSHSSAWMCAHFILLIILITLMHRCYEPLRIHGMQTTCICGTIAAAIHPKHQTSYPSSLPHPPSMFMTDKGFSLHCTLTSRSRLLSTVHLLPHFYIMWLCSHMQITMGIIPFYRYVYSPEIHSVWTN